MEGTPKMEAVINHFCLALPVGRPHKTKDVRECSKQFLYLVPTHAESKGLRQGLGERRAWERIW
jgi:hypothetical protein